MSEPTTAAGTTPAIPYAVPGPVESPRNLWRLGLVVTPLAALRLLALLVFVGGPILLRDAPRRVGDGRRPAGAMAGLVGVAAQVAAAGLLVAGGVVCLRRHPAGRIVLAWGAGLLLAATVWAAAMELAYLLSRAPSSIWAAGVLDIAECNAWDAAFPALLLLVCRR